MEIMQHRIIIELVCFQTLIFLVHHVNSEGKVIRGYCKDERNQTRCCSMFHLVEGKCVECPHGTHRYDDDLKCKECTAGYYGRFCAVMCSTCLQNQTCHLFPGGCKCHDKDKECNDRKPINGVNNAEEANKPHGSVTFVLISLSAVVVFVFFILLLIRLYKKYQRKQAESAELESGKLQQVIKLRDNDTDGGGSTKNDQDIDNYCLIRESAMIKTFTLDNDKLDKGVMTFSEEYNHLKFDKNTNKPEACTYSNNIYTTIKCAKNKSNHTAMNLPNYDRMELEKY